MSVRCTKRCGDSQSSIKSTAPIQIKQWGDCINRFISCALDNTLRDMITFVDHRNFICARVCDPSSHSCPCNQSASISFYAHQIGGGTVDLFTGIRKNTNFTLCCIHNFICFITMHFDTVFIIYCRGIFINLRRPISEHH